MTNKKFLFIGMAVLLSASLFLTGCGGDDDPEPTETTRTKVGADALDLSDLFDPPATDGTPDAAIDATANYTGTIVWKTGGNVHTGAFAAATVYTAEVTLEAASDRTFDGVAANTFSYTGAEVTHPAGTGISITVVVAFPSTPGTAESPVTVSGAALVLTEQVAQPATGETPQPTFEATTWYTGTIAWKNANDQEHSGAFAAETVYKAVLSLSAVTGYTFSGVTANTFSYDVSGATVTHLAGTTTTIEVTITFPQTLEAGGGEEHWYDVLGNGLTEEANVVTLATDKELSVSLEVPENKTLKIDTGTTLTVSGTATLTVTGSLTGTDATSKLDVGASATVTGVTVTAGTTYVWYNAAWTDETAYNTAVATAAAAALVAEGGTLNGNATVDGTTVTLNQSEVTIASGTTLNIPANVTLVVPNGKTFSMAGTFNITGAVTVESGGKYGFLNTGRGTSTGTITIENGGEVLSVPGSDMGGTGWTVIEAGGKAYAGASWEVKALFVGPSNGDAAIIKLASGSVATNNSGYKLDGVATVYGRSDAATNAQGTFWVGVVGSGATSAEKNKVLTIKAGGVLTVPGDDASTNKHILGVVTGEGDAEPGVVGEPANADNSKAAAQIVLQSHGYIDVYGPAPSSSSDYTQTIGNLNHNFYGTDGSTKVTENGLHDTTYNWVAAINSGAGGWQEAAE